MNDYESTMVMLDKVSHPHFSYTQLGVGGSYVVLVLDSRDNDDERMVAIMYFDLSTKAFVKAGVRLLLP